MTHKLLMFVGKCLVAVMFFLILDVVPDAGKMSFAYRKGTVSRLPGEPLQRQTLLIEDMRTAAFCLSQHIGDGGLWIEQKQQVNVVSNATDAVGVAAGRNQLLSEFAVDGCDDAG